jgi:hypothetical protein
MPGLSNVEERGFSGKKVERQAKSTAHLYYFVLFPRTDSASPENLFPLIFVVCLWIFHY